MYSLLIYLAKIFLGTETCSIPVKFAILLRFLIQKFLRSLFTMIALQRLIHSLQEKSELNYSYYRIVVIIAYCCCCFIVCSFIGISDEDNFFSSAQRIAIVRVEYTFTLITIHVYLCSPSIFKIADIHLFDVFPKPYFSFFSLILD